MLTQGQSRQERKGAHLVHSIRDDGGQSDSICPLKAFSVGATYFPFTVRSSSLPFGCGKKQKCVRHPELAGGLWPQFPDTRPSRASAFVSESQRRTEAPAAPTPRTGSPRYPETQPGARGARRRPGRQCGRRQRPRSAERAESVTRGWRALPGSVAAR